MSDESFGDWEEGDSFDTEPADPEQVAAHVHELRGYLAALSGEELEQWESLTEAEFDVAVDLGDRLITFLSTDQVHAAEAFHEAVAFLSGQPDWKDLSADVQQVAVGIVDDVIAWLTRQGALS